MAEPTAEASLVAGRIRARRVELGLSQERVANALGVNRTTVVNVEAGRQAVTAARLYQLAKVLDCEAAELLPHTGTTSGGPDLATVADLRARQAAEPLVMLDLAAEVNRQDEIHPAGYQATRDGVRLGLATVEDELREALDAHRDERRVEGWSHTYEELLQLAAVAVRTAAAIRSDADTRQHAANWAADGGADVHR